jgi:hypothetical protein
MVHLDLVRHDQCMGTHRDEKPRIIGDSVARAGEGSWFPPHEGDRTNPSRPSLTAIEASRLLAFRSFEVSPFLDQFLALAR